MDVRTLQCSSRGLLTHSQRGSRAEDSGKEEDKSKPLVNINEHQINEKLSEKGNTKKQAPKQKRDKSTAPEGAVTQVHSYSNKEKGSKDGGKLIKARPNAPSKGASKVDPHSSCVTAIDFDALCRRVKQLEQEIETVTSRSKHLLIHNCSEPTIREARIRKEAERRHVQDVLRLAGLPPNTPYLKCHRVGVWKGTDAASPRPMRVQFMSTFTRDEILSRASKVEEATAGNIKVTPDTAYFLDYRRKPSTSTNSAEYLKRPVVQVKQLEREPLEKSTPRTRLTSPVPNKPKTKDVVERCKRTSISDVKGGSPGSQAPEKTVTPKGSKIVHSIKTSAAEGSTTFASIVAQTPLDKSKGNTDVMRSENARIVAPIRAKTLRGIYHDISITKGGISWEVRDPEQEEPKEKNDGSPRVLRSRAFPKKGV